MAENNKTIIELGSVIKNRGEYSSSAKYYKDNVVQYQNSAYIVSSVPLVGYLQNVVPTTPNSGWETFAYGAAEVIAKTPRVDVSQSFTDAEKKQVRTNIGLGNGDIDDEPTANSNNLVKSGGIFNSQYQRLIEIDGEGDVFKETLIGEFMKGQKVFCKFIPWQTTSASSGSFIFRIRELYNGTYTVLTGSNTGQDIPTSFEFTAKEGAKYYLGGRADVGSQINGLFTYNYVDKEKFDNLESSVASLTSSSAANFTEINKKILQNINTLTYNGTYVVIDNGTRTITFNGNIIIVNTQGAFTTLITNNKSASFTAQSTAFTGASMGVLVYTSSKTLVVKQYDSLSNTDYALIGLKFDKALGNNGTTTARTDTKVLNYVSMLPIKFGLSTKEISDKVEYSIVEKRDSVQGVGNDTLTANKSIGTLTAGQTYYLYVNDFKHTSAQTGYLFLLRQNGTTIAGSSVTSGIESPYIFTAVQDAVYSYAGRCDSDDSIEVEFLVKEKSNAVDENEIKKISRNNDFNPILQSVCKNVSRNPKIGSFLYVTDLHANFASLNEMIRCNTALNPNINALLNGGDFVGAWPRTEEGQATISEYMSICRTNNIYHVLGQHEIGFGTSSNPQKGLKKSEVYSHQECFDIYFAPVKDSWGLPTLDKCYYYKDFDNVRLIALYQYNRPEVDDEDTDYYKYQRSLLWYGSEQLQWFADTLNSMSEGQVAIIFCHQPTQTIVPLSDSKFQSGRTAVSANKITTDDPITEILNAFVNKTSLTKIYQPTDTTTYLVSDGFEESVTVDFTNAEGTLGYMVMGDVHFDCVGKASNILCLCITSCGELVDGIITRNTGYSSDYIINALGVGASQVELGRVGQQYFCGILRDIERLSYNA